MNTYIIDSMSEAIAFDTHRFVRRLTECGFSERQAETLAEEHVALLNTNLATKTDIIEVKAKIEMLCQEPKTGLGLGFREINTGLELWRLETKAGLERMKSDFLRWYFVALIVQGSLIVALIKLL